MFCEADAIERWLGGPLANDASVTFNAVLNLQRDLGCPTGDGGALVTSHTTPQGSAYRCRHCRGLFVEAGVLPALRGKTARTRRSQSPGVPAQPARAPSRPDQALFAARLPEHDPRIALLALPCALLVAWLMSSSGSGRILMLPLQIQFHELGHALPAWLSSRAALPLPFGFTFFREEQSLFTGACVLFLCGVIAYRGYVERRRSALVLGGAFASLWALLSLLVPRDTSRMLVLMGGFVGELILPALVLVAFHFRFPDRLRWDFFRFLALPAGAGAWVVALRGWSAIAKSGTLPMGSLMPGDGNGDFPRLIAEYGQTPASIIALAGHCMWLSAAVVLLGYTHSALALLRSGALRWPRQAR